MPSKPKKRRPTGITTVKIQNFGHRHRSLRYGASGTDYSTDDPTAVLVIYQAMKQRILRRPEAPPLDPRYRTLSTRAYDLGGFLPKIFHTGKERNTVQCDLLEVGKILDKLLRVDDKTMAAIRDGTLARLPQG